MGDSNAVLSQDWNNRFKRGGFYPSSSRSTL
jgi:hypothetical protein